MAHALADDINEHGRTAQAKKIIDNYVDIRGNFSINIPSTIYDGIMALRHSADIQFTAFDAAELEIKTMLARDSYVRFIERQSH